MPPSTCWRVEGTKSRLTWQTGRQVRPRAIQTFRRSLVAEHVTGITREAQFILVFDVETGQVILHGAIG